MQALFESLGSSPSGLSSEQVRINRRRYGANRLIRGSELKVGRLLLGIFANPLVLVLLAASFISLGAGEKTNAVLIICIVSISSIIDFFQSYRSGRAAQKLRETVATQARVVRDGQEQEVALEDVVPGDIVLLQAGSIVPGDGRVVSAKDLCAYEAALTGESIPAEKQLDDPVYLGTSIVSGFGQILVTQVGVHSELGKVSVHLQSGKGETEFERGTRAFGMLILRTVLALVVFVFVTNVVFHRPPLESLLFSIALAVGLTPEFLPMIVSVSLTAGAVRLGEREVIVKRLSCIENLGSIDILCSDKTGTLTEGKIRLERYVDLAGEECLEVLRLAAINSHLESGIRSPMDEAILAHEHPDVNQYRKLDELPFDFVRRRLSVVAQGPDGIWLITKGAPEQVAQLCDLNQQQQQQLRSTFEALSNQGYRVLAVARRRLELQPCYSHQDEHQLQLVGLAAFLDPPRPDSEHTLRQLQQNAITVKILTGDNELVTRHVCERVGLTVEGLLLGSQVDSLEEAALGVVAERTTVFARLSPEQKLRVVRSLRARGHVVGYLGDGINDAPCLQNADIGISVEGAADVARESADLILLRPGLDPIHQGVLEGRRCFANILKYIQMGTSSNFGNMLSMAAASLFLPFLPLLPAQLLLNNLLYDLSQLGIPADRVDPAALERPRRWDVASIQRFMLRMGPISSVFDLLTFYLLLYHWRVTPELFRTLWFMESLATQVLVILLIRTQGRPWSSRPHPFLLGGVGFSLVTALSLPFSPLAPTLGFVPPPLAYLGYLGLVGLGYLVSVEWVKSKIH